MLPAARLARALVRKEVIESMNYRRLSLVVGVLLVGIVLFFVASLPHRVHCTFETRYAGAVQLYAPHAAMLDRVVAPPGEMVRQGELIAELRSADLELEIARLRSEVTQRDRELRALNYERFRDPQAIERVREAEELLAGSRTQLAERMADAASLRIVAPRDGYVLTPPRRAVPAGEATLASWTGTPLDARNAHAPLAAGDVVCEIGNPSRLEALLIADQAGVERLRTGQTVELVLDAQPLQIYRGKIAEISLDKLAAMPTGMSVHAGGQLASHVDSAGIDRPASPSYSVVVPLTANEELPPAAGLRGSARVATGSETLAMRSWRFLCRTFRVQW
jgi:putative peptide zinc metalloprotease protein